MKKGLKFIIIIVITLIIGVGGTYYGLSYFGYLDSKTVEKNVTNITLSETGTIKPAIDKVYDSSMYIETYSGNNLAGSGSGFVYKTDDKYGYILTNYHVIDGATKVEVTNVDGETVTATILGGDEYTDIAVLRIDKVAALLTATLAENDSTEIGDTVFTVGSPLGKTYMGTVTKGIISGKDREVTVASSNSGNYIMSVLQLDAALNPGNSGGPLVNINGEVIGITSMKLVEDEVEGMGFAIPTEIINTVLDKLEKNETIERPLLGISMLDVDSTYALYRNGITLSDDIESGVVVVEVANNSPAFTAVFKKGDVILSIDGTNIDNVAYLRAKLYTYSVGDIITIKYIRNNSIKEVKVNLNVALGDS